MRACMTAYGSRDSALGASNLTYAEATYTQRGPDWIASHVRMLEYFGGAPRVVRGCFEARGGPRPGDRRRVIEAPSAPLTR